MGAETNVKSLKHINNLYKDTGAGLHIATTASYYEGGRDLTSNSEEQLINNCFLDNSDSIFINPSVNAIIAIFRIMGPNINSVEFRGALISKYALQGPGTSISK